jgi:hypothetical protein
MNKLDVVIARELARLADLVSAGLEPPQRFQTWALEDLKQLCADTRRARAATGPRLRALADRLHVALEGISAEEVGTRPPLRAEVAAVVRRAADDLAYVICNVPEPQERTERKSVPAPRRMALRSFPTTASAATAPATAGRPCR